MKLVYLPANQAWIFLFGDSIQRVGNNPLFFKSSFEAVHAAKSVGLHVYRNGSVHVEPEDIGLPES